MTGKIGSIRIWHPPRTDRPFLHVVEIFSSLGCAIWHILSVKIPSNFDEYHYYSGGAWIGYFIKMGGGWVGMETRSQKWKDMGQNGIKDKSLEVHKTDESNLSTSIDHVDATINQRNLRKKTNKRNEQWSHDEHQFELFLLISQTKLIMGYFYVISSNAMGEAEGTRNRITTRAIGFEFTD